MPLRIMIACGGSGGHLVPGIAIGEALLHRGHQVHFLVSTKKIDLEVMKGYPGLSFEKIPSIAMPKIFSWKMASFLFCLMKAIWFCQRKMAQVNTDAILGMGGFTSIPAVLAGKLRRKMVFIHESNVIPGKANRVSFLFSDMIFLGFDACRKSVGGRENLVVGNPVRKALRKKRDHTKAKVYFGLNEEQDTLLVMGGSQGGRRINEEMLSVLPQLEKAAIQVIHLTGLEDQEWVEREYQKHRFPFKVLSFEKNMHYAYAAADLVVARSGASTLTELAYFALPAILIPFPHSAADHQTKNAQFFVDAEAAILFKEEHFTSVNFSEFILKLMGDKERLRILAENSAKLSHRHVEENMCEVLEKKLKRNP